MISWLLFSLSSVQSKMIDKFFQYICRDSTNSTFVKRNQRLRCCAKLWPKFMNKQHWDLNWNYSCNYHASKPSTYSKLILFDIFECSLSEMVLKLLSFISVLDTNPATIQRQTNGKHVIWLRNRLRLNARQSITIWLERRKCNKHWPNQAFSIDSLPMKSKLKLFRTFSRDSIPWTAIQRMDKKHSKWF